MRSWDLMLSGAILIAALGMLVFGRSVLNPAAVAVLLFLPGYLLHLTLFPEKRHPSERAGMSFLLSVALLSLSSMLPGTSRLQAASILLLSMVLIFAALYRRSRAPSPWEPELRSPATLLLLLLPLLLLGYALYTSSQGERAFTELYVVEPPEKVRAGVPFPLHIGIANHEGSSMQYTLSLTATGSAGTLNLHREALSLPPLPVEKGVWKRQWEKNITISLPEGSWTIDVSLRKPSGEELHLYIHTEAG